MKFFLERAPVASLLFTLFTLPAWAIGPSLQVSSITRIVRRQGRTEILVRLGSR